VSSQNLPPIRGTATRRSLLRGAVATASILTLVRTAFPPGTFAQAKGPETTKARIGYIALTDAAPLIIAKEKGLFAKCGMPDVEILRQASWGGRGTISSSAAALAALTGRIS
jgi:nitrate/nitrite transport system substrate-binding protein